MNELIDLLIRSVVSGVGTGIGSYFVLRLLFHNIEKAVSNNKDKEVIK
jgi:hypothetical protein